MIKVTVHHFIAKHVLYEGGILGYKNAIDQWIDCVKDDILSGEQIGDRFQGAICNRLLL